VLQRAQEEMLNFQETGSSVMSCPIAGGGCGTIRCCPIESGGSPGATWTTLSTGRWSESAAKEAEKYLQVRKVHAPKPHASDSSDSEDSERNGGQKLSDNAAYVYSTVDGVEFSVAPRTPPGVPLVADMSSNMMSRPNLTSASTGWCSLVLRRTLTDLPVSRVVIVREDLMDGRALPFCPSVLSYHVTSRNGFAVQHAANLQHLRHWPGDAVGSRFLAVWPVCRSCRREEIVASLHCPVDKSCAPRMNIVFRLSGGEALEKRFTEEAAKQGLTNLEGHRSIGGLRASLYNAVTIADTRTLASFMRDFAKRVAQIDLV
uniref:phosphoserine transaminase n=1 Tax=Macrostomum lignano TaxID=282301 RepID=A0A1I8FP96_9PLAT